MKKKRSPAILSASFSASHVLFALLALSIGAYVLTQNVLFAFASFALIISLFVSDFSVEQGWKQNALELAYALGFAVAAWFLLGFALQTDSPINVVTSCSMLPSLQRGDLVFIQGGSVKAPEVQAPFEELRSVKVRKGVCYLNSVPLQCTDRVLVANETIDEGLDNDIIVFDPKPTGPGLLIHRAFAKIRTEQGVFFLTKGDNNAVLDQENGRFSFVAEKDVKGRVVLAIPYVGYLKLFLFLQFEVPPGCDSVLMRA
ncbi:MAG: hypothetical protein QXR53_00620 [Candidatus Norongarragalinales archaeon]